MVYVYSAYSKYNYKITKYKQFVKIVKFNFDTNNYEVFFEFPNYDLLNKFENHYEIISEKEYSDELDFIKNNDLMGLNKIYMFTPSNIQFYEISIEIKYFDLIHNFFAKTEIDLWNEYFKVMHESRMKEFVFEMIDMFFREDEEIFYEHLSVF